MTFFFCWQTSSVTDDLAARTNSDSDLCTRRCLQGKSSCSDVPRQPAKLSLRVLTTLTGFPSLSCYYATSLTHSVRVTYASWASSYPQAGAVSASQSKGIWHLGSSETLREEKRNTCGPEVLLHPIQQHGSRLVPQVMWFPISKNEFCWTIFFFSACKTEVRLY